MRKMEPVKGDMNHCRETSAATARLAMSRGWVAVADVSDKEVPSIYVDYECEGLIS